MSILTDCFIIMYFFFFCDIVVLNIDIQLSEKNGLKLFLIVVSKGKHIESL